MRYGRDAVCRAYWFAVNNAGGEPSAFLSHASEDKTDFVDPLGRELAARGVRPWLDKWEIGPGDSLVQRLFDEGIAAVDAVVVVVSRFSAGKRWVRAELDAATVRRITEDTHLIPVRLDKAEMPAPLRPLKWIDADRTAESVARAAGEIADKLHGRELRPAVAPPPSYTAATQIAGLTAADSALVVVMIEEAITAESLLGLGWSQIQARAASNGLDGDVLAEALAALEQRRYAKVLYAAGQPHTVDLAPSGFAAGVGAVVSGAGQARDQVIAMLVNEPPAGVHVADALAEATGTPVLFVLEFLRDLERRGYLHVMLGSGRSSRVVGISAALRRLVA